LKKIELNPEFFLKKEWVKVFVDSFLYNWSIHLLYKRCINWIKE
jgi:hypothetical protein